MGLDPLTALLLPFQHDRPNTHTFTIFEKDTHEVLAVFGAMPVSKRKPKIAAIWFLSSEKLDKHGRFILKNNLKWGKYLESHYKYVYNFITSFVLYFC